MQQQEIHAKLVTIERLLIILLSDKRYAELIEDARGEIHREFGEPLNAMFPSDQGYFELKAVLDNFNFTADIIKINQDHGLLE